MKSFQTNKLSKVKKQLYQILEEFVKVQMEHDQRLMIQLEILSNFYEKKIKKLIKEKKILKEKQIEDYENLLKIKDEQIQELKRRETEFFYKEEDLLEFSEENEMED